MSGGHINSNPRSALYRRLLGELRGWLWRGITAGPRLARSVPNLHGAQYDDGIASYCALESPCQAKYLTIKSGRQGAEGGRIQVVFRRYGRLMGKVKLTLAPDSTFYVKASQFQSVEIINLAPPDPGADDSTLITIKALYCGK
jgi:hypothetical protein